MSRKIFISVLGTGNYSPCVYGHVDFRSTDTRFVQQAAMEYVGVKEWKENDCVYFLLTDSARTRNWENRLDERTGNELVGLKNIVASMELACHCQELSIKTGNDGNEMWQIFQQLYDIIEEGDEIYMDLTHGFRYLPMLVLVFGNYAKFLKNVSVCHLSYGNFEAMRELNLDYAPLVDLLPLSELQDWTFASADFLKNGDARNLQKLCNGFVSMLFQQKPGQEQRKMLSDMNKFINALQDLTESMRLCRGHRILESDKWGYLQKMAEQVKASVIPPMAPIVTSIQDSFSRFEPSEDVRNGYHAFVWCYEHNLYQQGITILLETMISHVAQLYGYAVNDKDDREIVARTINSLNPKKAEEDQVEDSGVDKLREQLLNNEFFDTLLPMYWDLCGIRNDINHSGLLETAAKNDTFGNKLDKYVTIVNQLIK